MCADMDRWDPLAVQPADGDIVVEARRREIRNILKSYTGYFDPFCELLQNALDAVDDRRRANPGADYRPTIWIDINLQTNTITVADNGIGFGEDNFRTFLTPNISFKDPKTHRGRKGVGATYLAYGFNDLTLSTKTPTYQASARIQGGRDWVEGVVEGGERPVVQRCAATPPLLDEFDQGAAFALLCEGENVRPSDLSWIQATTANQWKYILLWKTPLGHVDFSGGQVTVTRFNLRVTKRNEDVTELRDQEARYILPHAVIATSVEAAAIQAERQRRLAEGAADVDRLPARFYERNGVYGIWRTEDIVALERALTDEERAIVREFGMTAYGYFCYSVRVWDAVNDNQARLRRGARMLHGGLLIATAGMVQGDSITIPLTSNIGYQNQTHVIVHIEGAEPDLGRKGFQPEIVKTAASVATAIVSQLKKYRRYLKTDAGEAPGIAEAAEVHEWLREQERHAADAPLTLEHDEFFKPVAKVPMLAVPQSEQDVVSLFNQFIAGGIIRSVRVMAASSHARYDGVFKYVIEEPFENHKYDAERNPLGVERDYDRRIESAPMVLEYKHNVDALVREFENGEKDEQTIALVVAWEMGEEWKKRYRVISLLDEDNRHRRVCHGQTHEFLDSTTGARRFHGVILGELVAYLNDSAAAQAWQRERYGAEE